MNSDVFQGKWKKAKGQVKEAFGNLTDDDLLRIEGNADQAAGVLQERYGYSRDRAEREWNGFLNRNGYGPDDAMDDAEDAAHDAKNKVKSAATDLKNNVKDTYTDIKNNAKDVATDIKNNIESATDDLKHRVGR